MKRKQAMHRTFKRNYRKALHTPNEKNEQKYGKKQHFVTRGAVVEARRVYRIIKTTQYFTFPSLFMSEIF